MSFHLRAFLALDVALCETIVCTLQYCQSLALHAGGVVSGENGAKATAVEDARHALNAARASEEAEMPTQIDKSIAMAIGNAFCDTTLLTGSVF